MGAAGTARGRQLPVSLHLDALHERLRALSAGAPATYIPPLAQADPSWFGIAIATVDGHIYEVGDARHPFTIQSVSKPFAYGMALEDVGVDQVLSKVGVEPPETRSTRSASTSGRGAPPIPWSTPAPSSRPA